MISNIFVTDNLDFFPQRHLELKVMTSDFFYTFHMFDIFPSIFIAKLILSCQVSIQQSGF